MKMQRTSASAFVASALLYGCTGFIEGPPQQDAPGLSGATGTPGMPGTAGSQAPGGATGTVPGQTATSSGPSRLWLLTQVQHANTIATLFGGRSTSGTTGLAPLAGLTPVLAFKNTDTDRFSTRAGSYAVRASELPDLMKVAEEVASKLTDALAQSSCLSSGTDFAACIQNIVREKGELLFRRPVTQAEIQQYADFANEVKAVAGEREATKYVLRAMLAAPQFLYRSEVGAPVVGQANRRQLTPYEVASAISYSVTDAPPDQPLWDAAKSGALANPAEIRAQIARLLAAPGGSAPLERFLEEYFRYGAVMAASKEQAFHKGELLLRDTRLLIDDVVSSHAGADLFEALLTTKTGYVSVETATNYGLEGASEVRNAQGKPIRVAFSPSSDRLGILGQPSWLAAFAQPEHTDVIRRGRFVRETFLCKHVPAIDILNVPPLPEDPKLTMREKLAMHTSDSTCAGCHGQMDPLGLGLEAFDEVGRERSMEVGKPVNVQGTLVGSNDQDGPFVGLTGLTEKVVASETFRQCVVSHSFEYWMGRPPSQADEGDRASIDGVYRDYKDAGYDYKALLAALFTSEAFLFRKP